MKQLIKDHLDQGISRRQHVSGLSARGMNGVAKLKASGVEYLFFNPSTGDHPIFDALVDVPEIHLIEGMQEGAVIAMADGYARAAAFRLSPDA